MCLQVINQETGTIPKTLKVAVSEKWEKEGGCVLCVCARAQAWWKRHFSSFLFFHLLLNYCYWCVCQLIMNPILHDARLFMKIRKYSFIHRWMFKNCLERNIPNMKSVYLHIVSFFSAIIFSCILYNFQSDYVTFIVRRNVIKGKISRTSWI